MEIYIHILHYSKSIFYMKKACYRITCYPISVKGKAKKTVLRVILKRCSLFPFDTLCWRLCKKYVFIFYLCYLWKMIFFNRELPDCFTSAKGQVIKNALRNFKIYIRWLERKNRFTLYRNLSINQRRHSWTFLKPFLMLCFLNLSKKLSPLFQYYIFHA